MCKMYKISRKSDMNAITLITTFLFMNTSAPTANRFDVRPLPYAYEALEPAVSAETMRYHHDKHYAGYVAKLNELILDTPFADQPLEDIITAADGAIFNNAAQAWNHEFFFATLSPEAQHEPSGRLMAAIERDFGSFDHFKRMMTEAATSLFGSGWVWLAENRDGRLVLLSEPNAGTPIRRGMKPLMCIDLWEHAYYIDYRNRRADSVASIWDVIDWKTVERRYDR